jgi:predicted methyltransferase
MHIRHITGLTAFVLVTACATQTSGSDLPPAEAPPPPAMETSGIDQARLDAAISNTARPETDTERDSLRMPAGVIEFMDLEPGETVLELEAGSGYFTEVFSHYLLASSTLYMHNPAAFDGFLGDAAEVRMEGLENVEYVKSQFDEFPLVDESVDVVTWFQGPHELWYTPENGEPLVGNPDASFPEIFRVLKPGGSFIVLDHTARGGSPASTGGDTHRIDPQIVRDLGREAGFVLVAESDILDNPDDDLTANVFDEAVRGRTDQFLLKFEKPARSPL